LSKTLHEVLNVFDGIHKDVFLRERCASLSIFEFCRETRVVDRTITRGRRNLLQGVMAGMLSRGGEKSAAAQDFEFFMTLHATGTFLP